ncbi:peptide transporter [Burkholderia ubonensis]|uniref:Peptide transporter n=3 Tax=Burkholderia ubonensis TaxID=101571 RepID=A0ABD4E7N8_9BURK|nr:peptide transporter [Burkholderia ubonensis]KVO84321.1 peptide transporter [Burkholderia ubonensis]KVZ62689.1 peptide transporter [Burkholderia ubonensis]KVZ67319.1 peptide transporter [Burkholderia ubonensis]OJB18330.1 peptide transporter [Burkholderia ubonensis]
MIPKTAKRRAFASAMLAILSSTAAAQSYEAVAPVPPPSRQRPAAAPMPAPSTSDAAQVAVAKLQGLAFFADGETTNRRAATAIRHGPIVATGLPLIDEDFLRGFEADIGKPLTFAQLANIRAAVVQRYREAGEPLVDVYVPEQDVTNGVVRIAVATFHAGNVIARGNRHFSDALLVREMPTTRGAPILDADVAKGLALLNANPYRHVDVLYVPGAERNATDVVLQTDDRLPLRVTAGYNDAGVPQLGRDRFFAGIDYGNLFGLDQQIAWQTTVSNDFFSGNPPIEGRPNRSRFIAHSFRYVAPLPWFDRVELFGLFARSTPRLPDNYGQTGISTQLSFRYDWLLPVVAGWQQQAQIGYDFKRSNNNLEFGGMQVFHSNAHTHQFSLAYDAIRMDTLGQSHVNVAVVVSPGHLDADNEQAAYNTVRLGATPRYAYTRISAQRNVMVGAGFSASALALLQWTPNTLLPAEEIGLGGDDSVRGYAPYVVQGDRGWNIQTELRAPSLAFSGGDMALQPFIFFDAGHVWNRIDQPAEAGNAALASVGAGLRFEIGRFVSVRCTYGQPLRTATPGGSKAPLGQIFAVFGS